MKFTKLQLLNITTGVLHTKMDDIYTFFDVIEEGVMIYMLPRALRAVQPLLMSKCPHLPDKGFHPNIDNPNEEFEIIFSDEEKGQFWKNYEKLPNPSEGKNVITVKT